MKITITAKKETINSNGNRGTRICYAYHDETFEGFPVSSIWVPIKFKKPDDIIVGEDYDMKTYLDFVVRLTPLNVEKEN